MKKKVLFLLLGAVALLAIILHGSRETEIPVPEEIRIYQNGAVCELKDTDPVFSEILPLLGMGGQVQETAIDPEAVEEVKAVLAVECIYQDTQYHAERPYTRLLFSLSGWTEDSVLLYWNGRYLSGTYESRIFKPKLAVIMKNLQP